MAWSCRDILIRVTLLVVLSLGLLCGMSPWLKTTRTRLGASVDLQEEGVRLQFGGDGTVTIRLDGKQETIPSSEADDSKMYQEALHGHRPGSRAPEMNAFPLISHHLMKKPATTHLERLTA